MKYPVTLTKDTDGTFFVRFPDVPEAIAHGDTEEEALARAVDALMTVFDFLMRSDRNIPAPTVDASTKLLVQLPPHYVNELSCYVRGRRP
jgi:predicted RNase H-like HicB family nuclease